MNNLLNRESKAAFRQKGWLGATGTYYTIDTPVSDIHSNEPGSYQPLYEQVGEWYFDEDLQDWRVEWAD